MSNGKRLIRVSEAGCVCRPAVIEARILPFHRDRETSVLSLLMILFQRYASQIVEKATPQLSCRRHTHTHISKGQRKNSGL